ncbi:MAG: polymer-forming cytoskeletal protein [Herminiimonas sp.]|nr:polymer-forming cytoskeletal protein [Herminiimonas sp.]
MIIVAYSGFFSVCVAFMVIAFRPAYREWRMPTDCQPLPVSKCYTRHTGHFAEAFRHEILSSLAASPEACTGLFEPVPMHAERMDWEKATRPLIAFHALRLQRSVKCAVPLYVNADLHSIGHDTFSGLFAAGHVHLGPHSELREWAHAEGWLTLGVSCVALRRVSSALAIELKNRCCFERLHAPTIYFGAAYRGTASRGHTDGVLHSFESVPGAIRRSDSLFMVQGNCVLPRHRRFAGSLIVTGHLVVGAYTIVEGDIKARKGLSLGSESIVTGSVVSEGDIKLFHRARVGGVVISEQKVIIGTGAEIGTIDQPSTISAEAIIVEAGVIAHGTVWARDVGTVWSS